MVKNREINGTEEIGLVTPTLVSLCIDVSPGLNELMYLQYLCMMNDFMSMSMYVHLM